MIKIRRKEDCCGCHACAQVCPKQCIVMTYDEEGFLYPKVDESLCIDCGTCERACPWLAAENDKPVIPPQPGTSLCREEYGRRGTHAQFLGGNVCLACPTSH